MRSWIIALIAFVGGAAVGATTFRRPARVEYREKEAIKWREKESVASAVSVARVEGPTVRVEWRERTVTEPGGTVIVERWREREDKGPVSTNLAATKIEVREVQVDKVRDVLRIETRTPTWRASLMPGVSMTEPLISLPSASRAVLGVAIERQIVGPFSAGIWASTSGAAGISAAVAW
jgi:hypothetical protein